MEGKLVAGVIARLCSRDNLDQLAIERLQESLARYGNVIDGLGFCLSEDGDLLSQWRGYADNATGVSVGFHRAYLEWLADQYGPPKTTGTTLKRVHYDPKEHEAEVDPTYREIRELVASGAFRLPGPTGLLDSRTREELEHDRKGIEQANSQVSAKLISLFPKLFLLKSPAFREEREWRLLTHTIRGGNDKCSYRALPDRVVPYRTCELLRPQGPRIVEVVLGPKHLTPPTVIEGLLKQHGYGAVRVKRSTVTYR